MLFAQKASFLATLYAYINTLSGALSSVLIFIYRGILAQTVEIKNQDLRIMNN